MTPHSHRPYLAASLHRAHLLAVDHPSPEPVRTLAEESRIKQAAYRRERAAHRVVYPNREKEQ